MTFSVATNEYRGGGNGERTEYHACVAWDIWLLGAN
jgi:single-stranded DNA-binding protein